MTMERLTIEALSRGDQLYRAPPRNSTETEVRAWLAGIWRFYRADRLAYLESTTDYWRTLANEAEERWWSSPHHLRELNGEAAAQTAAWLRKHLADIDRLRAGIPPEENEVVVKVIMRANTERHG